MKKTNKKQMPAKKAIGKRREPKQTENDEEKAERLSKDQERGRRGEQSM